jgi:hypothetical protein
MVAKRRSGRLSIGLVVLVGASGLLTGAGGAQPDTAQLKNLVSDLGSSDIAKREDAMRILSSDDSITLAQLEGLLKAPDLSPEQRCRITQAAKQRFMSSPRPAMGVQFDNRLPDRVAIEKVYPKFPAAQFLRPGDLIVSCNGEKLHALAPWVRLGAHIFSREPGDSISLVVRRGAEKLEMEIPLGLYRDLAPADNLNIPRDRGPDQDRLERAWELRTRGFSPQPIAVIDPKLPPTDWKPDPSFMQTQKLARYKPQMNAGYHPTLVAGGEPRGGELDYDQLILMTQQNPAAANQIINRAWAQQQLMQQGMGVGWGSEGGLVQTTQQELSGLENRRLSLQHQLDDLKMPGAARPDQVGLVEARAQVVKELERTKKQIEAIRAETAEEQAAADANEPASPSPQR